jgi:hypothetical protein
MDESALNSLPSRPLVDGALRAIARKTFAPFLYSLSNASHSSFTLQAIIKSDLSYVMYMVSLHLTSSMLTYLAGLAGTRPRSIFGGRSLAACSSRPPSSTPPHGWPPRV